MNDNPITNEPAAPEPLCVTIPVHLIEKSIDQLTIGLQNTEELRAKMPLLHEGKPICRSERETLHRLQMEAFHLQNMVSTLEHFVR